MEFWVAARPIVGISGRTPFGILALLGILGRDLFWSMPNEGRKRVLQTSSSLRPMPMPPPTSVCEPPAKRRLTVAQIENLSRTIDMPNSPQIAAQFEEVRVLSARQPFLSFAHIGANTGCARSTLHLRADHGPFAEQFSVHH